MGINWESHKESLQLLLNSGASYEEMGRKYNCSGANIKKVLKKLGFTLSPRRTINSKEHFNKCVYTKNAYIVVILLRINILYFVLENVIVSIVEKIITRIT